MGKYKVMKKLGQGSYGSVFLVQDSKDSRLFVMKKIAVTGMNATELTDCKREIQILSMLEHPNIIGYQRSFVRRGALCIVMDYADNGDLHRMIHRQRKVVKAGGGGFSEDQVLNWLTQVALGLRHIHQHRILHRDLKTQNIFLCKNGQVRLGDFGISRVMAHTMDQAKTLVGTPYYLSPEMVNGLPYDAKTDMWSLGVVLYEMLTLEHPFNADSLQMLALRIIQGNYPPVPAHYSPGIKDLLAKLLQQDPIKRLSVGECLDHEMMRSRVVHFGQLYDQQKLIKETASSRKSTRPSGKSDDDDDDEVMSAAPKVLVRRSAGQVPPPAAYPTPAPYNPAAYQTTPYATPVSRTRPPPIPVPLPTPVLYDAFRADPKPASRQHGRRTSTVVSMDQDDEPDWSSVQSPIAGSPQGAREPNDYAPYAAKTPQRAPAPAVAPPPPPQRRSDESMHSRAYQISILRGHLQTKLGVQVLSNLIDVLASGLDDHQKSTSVKRLIGPHQEVLPIVHTLLYLEQR